MYRTLFGLLATLAAALLVAGLSFSTTVDTPAEVRFINSAEPESLDPQQLTSQPGGRIVLAIFEGLTRYDAKTMAPAPGVAKSWDISDDGLRYTFHLRDEACWSDGTALGASDFVYSWRRILDPKLGAKYAYMLHPLKGAKALNTFEGLAHTIDETLLPALSEALKRANGSDLPGETWRALLTRLPVHDSLQHSNNEEVRSLLDRSAAADPRQEPAVPVQQLERFIPLLHAEAERLRQVAHDVSSRFGDTLGVYAADPHTLIVELEAPTPYFLDVTSYYPTLPVPRQVVEKYGNAWFLPETIVSNGAFELASWRVNDRIRLRRSERYWGRSEVKAKSIEALPTENGTTALNLYLTGEVEWFPSTYPVDLVSELRKRPDFYAHPAFTVYYYRFNTRRPPLDDARVREAINFAVDRQLITDKVLGLGQLPATLFVPPGVRGYEPPPSHLGLDIDRARRLLAAAGYPDGKGFPEIGILYNTLEAHKKIAEVVADQLKKNLGINVTAFNQEWQSYLASVRAGSFQMARAAWIGDYLDPNTFLDMWVTNGGNNQTGFSSSSYDSIIRAAADMGRFAEHPQTLLAQLKDPSAISSLLAQRQSSLDTVERRTLLEVARMRLLAEAEAILVQDEFPIMPIYFYVEGGLRAPSLHGLYTDLELADGRTVPNLRGMHPLRDLWVSGKGH